MAETDIVAEKTGEVDLLGRKHVQGRYDTLANNYDQLWNTHVRAPNDKLTASMKLKHGERICDLACGTGTYTLDMARLSSPGEVVGVDYSEGMLATAKERLAAEKLPITLVHSKIEDFLETCPSESFDAISVRFALAYIDWQAALPKFGRLVRPGGSIAILGSTSAALPQLWEVWRKLTDGWPGFELKAPVPDSNDQIAELLARGGLTKVDSAWDYDIRLWFDSGEQSVTWLRESGYGTHPALQNLDPDAIKSLMQVCAMEMEAFRQDQGVPLDLATAGIVVRK